MSQHFQLNWVGIRRLSYGLLFSSGLWVVWTWWPWWQAAQRSPEMIIVLGGGIRREVAAAQLAQIHPHLPVIISSGSTLPCLYRVFVKEAGVNWQHVTVDFRAVDTLTNFTAVLPYIQSGQPRKVFVVSTEGHWSRAAVLGWLIWGSRGIAIEPFLIKGIGHEESWEKTLLDSLRAIAWLAVGNTTVDHLYHSPTYVSTQKQIRSSRCETGEATLPNLKAY